MRIPGENFGKRRGGTGSMLISVVLSVLIIFVWSYFFVPPDALAPTDATEEVREQFPLAIEDGRRLAEGLDGLTRGDVDVLIATGQVCAVLACGSMTETQAAQVIASIYTERQRAESQWIGRFGIGVAILSLVVSVLALRRGNRADERSDRNERQITTLLGSAR